MYKFATMAVLLLVTISIGEISEKQILDLAQSNFDSTVPNDIRNEFYYIGIERSSIDDNFYNVKWERRVNGFRVFEDRFIVTIDSTNGNIANMHYVYSTPASQIDTNPALTQNQAKWVAERYYAKVSEPPELVIIGGKLIYRTKVGSGAIIGIDADTGESQILAVPLGGTNINQVPTKFDPMAYYLDVYGIYIAFGAIAIAGVTYWKFFAHKKK